MKVTIIKKEEVMKDFLWGSATASYQCEGAWNEDGKIENMWDRYLHENHLEDGDVASDHYHHYKEDIHLMKLGGQNAYRFSLAWGRILDEQGHVNPKGVAYYRDVLKTCHDEGVVPFVTIYHWDLPQYLEAKGGWLNVETCYAYEYYAKVCFEQFGDLITHWTTFNEPKWFTSSGYLIGNYPPAHQSVQEMITAAYHVMFASALAVRAFKEGNYPGMIGIVHSFGPVDGIDDTLKTKIAMRFADNYANNWVLDTACTGEFPFDLLCVLSQNYDLSFMKEEHLSIIKDNTVQFLGLNYYARVYVKPYTEGETCFVVNNNGMAGSSKIVVKGWFEQIMDNPDAIYTEWDTEIYPQGLQKGLVQVYEKYHLPIFITENGVGVREDVSVAMVEDDYRISFMNDHLNAILNAKDLGVDVRGYFAWSTFDLYSWKNGTEKRYGLVAIDYENELKRKPKKSYFWYKKVIESAGKAIQRKIW